LREIEEKEQVVTHVLLYAMKIESGVVGSVLVARHHLMSMLSRERERERVCLSALNETKERKIRRPTYSFVLGGSLRVHDAAPVSIIHIL